MTRVHKAGNLHKNADGLSRWALPKTPDNPPYVPTGAEPQIPIEEIKIIDVGTEFCKEVRDSYMLAKNFHILTSLLKNIAKIQLWPILWMILGKNLMNMEDSIYLMEYYIIHLNPHVSWSCVVEC
ncbi:hypothetical protein O181_077483 [Austropuccinia psidii MF-1]|uniref:Uncharacterized protein n=1 Tax=Austropuccinia psidii MF-1 TaxID=1389203 RepID=A0A9Q3FCW0_9BASI|nr:hypothetical protein [Austropuccinia psidii MF-1]